jgi:hypothetical protein
MLFGCNLTTGIIRRYKVQALGGEACSYLYRFNDRCFAPTVTCNNDLKVKDYEDKKT